MRGILRKIIAGFCYVEADNMIYECKLRGGMRRHGTGIFAGDNVVFSPIDDSHGVIEKTENRKNMLIRPPLANIDRLVIVSSHNTPAPNSLIIDRLTAIACSKDIEPIIVFNKCDLGDMSEWSSIYENAGLKTFTVSAMIDSTIESLKEYLLDFSGITAFTGNSGVGKSSILNTVFPDLKLKTGDVSDKLGRGRHTTRQVELYKLESGGYIADTPGFSSLDLQRSEFLSKDILPDCFPEFRKYLGECKFNSCSHTCEKGCAVISALNEGKIEMSRYENYKNLYSEVKDVKEWEIKKKNTP